MTTEDYSWLKARAILYFQEQAALEKAAKQPHLTLVTETTLITENERTSSMDTPTEQTAEPVTVTPLHGHGAFYDMEAAIRLLTLGANALKGIGLMMQPEHHAGDEQLNGVRRSDISAIFEFFGECLSDPASIASDAAQRLELAAAGKNS